MMIVWTSSEVVESNTVQENIDSLCWQLGFSGLYFAEYLSCSELDPYTKKVVMWQGSLLIDLALGGNSW